MLWKLRGVSVVFLTVYIAIYIFTVGGPLTVCAFGIAKEPVRMRQAGEDEYLRLAVLADRSANKDPETSSCWQHALAYFRDVSLSCDMMHDSVKSLVALTLTKCHYTARHDGFPTNAVGCDIASGSAVALCTTGDFDPTDAKLFATGNPSAAKHNAADMYSKDGTADNPTTGTGTTAGTGAATGTGTGSADCEAIRRAAVASCQAALTESAFTVFIQFMNHVDNICFYIQSTLWQEKTEQTVQALSNTASNVVLQLDHAKSVQTRLVAEAQTEREKMKSFFDEVFSVIYRLQYFQRMLSTQLSDFGTSFTYVVLIVATYFLTSSKATNRVRVPIYLVWTAMLVTEVVTYRVVAYSRVHDYDWPHTTFANPTYEPHPPDQPSIAHVLTAATGGYSKTGTDIIVLTFKFCTFVLRLPLKLIFYALVAVSKNYLTDDNLPLLISWYRWFYVCVAAAMYLRAWWSYKDPSVATYEAVEDLRAQFENVKELAAAINHHHSAGTLFAPFFARLSGNMSLMDSTGTGTGTDSFDYDMDPEYSPFLDELEDRNAAHDYSTDDGHDTPPEDDYKFNNRRMSLPTAALGHRPVLGHARRDMPASALPDRTTQRRNPGRNARPKSLKEPSEGRGEAAADFNPALLFETPDMFERDLHYNRMQASQRRLHLLNAIGRPTTDNSSSDFSGDASSSYSSGSEDEYTPLDHNRAGSHHHNSNTHYTSQYTAQGTSKQYTAQGTSKQYTAQGTSKQYTAQGTSKQCEGSKGTSTPPRRPQAHPTQQQQQPHTGYQPPQQRYQPPQQQQHQLQRAGSTYEPLQPRLYQNAQPSSQQPRSLAPHGGDNLSGESSQYQYRAATGAKDSQSRYIPPASTPSAAPSQLSGLGKRTSTSAKRGPQPPLTPSRYTPRRSARLSSLNT